MLTCQVARTIVQFGLGLEYVPLAPTIAFPNLTEGELAARRDLVATLLKGGVIAPTENWIRAYLGLPTQP